MTSDRLSRRARLGVVALGCAISAVAVYLALRGVNLDDAARIVGSAAPGWLAAAVGVLAVQTLVRAERWRRLLPAGPRPRPRLVRVVPPLLVGYLGNTVLPARLGEPLRAGVLARREDLSASEVFGSVLLERVLDTVALSAVGLVAVALVGLPAGFAAPVAVGLVVGMIGVGAVVLAPGVVDRLSERRLNLVGRFIVAVGRGAAVRERRPVVVVALALSTVAWMLDAGIYWCVGQAVGVELTFQAAVVVSAIAALSTAIPAAPGYVGTYELAVTTALAVLGVPPDAALAFAVCVHAAIIVPMVIAGGISALLVARPGAAPAPAERPASDVARRPA